jgi:hypothetical protein
MGADDDDDIVSAEHLAERNINLIFKRIKILTISIEYKFESDLVKAENLEGEGRKKRTTRKGVLITILLVAAIVGASFLVYYIP